MSVTIRGVTFIKLGPVDRRQSTLVSKRGRYLCPWCSDLERHRIVGFFGTHLPEHLIKHMKQDHYRCTQCYWVGVRPGQHVRRGREHEAFSPNGERRLRYRKVRLFDRSS